MEPARYSLSVDDYVAYNRRICGRRFGRPMAFAVAVLGFIAIMDYRSTGNLFALYCALIGLAFLVLYLSVSIPRHARAIFSEQPSLSETRTLTVDEESVEFRQPSGTFRTEWRSLIQWDETPRLLVLYVNRAMFIAIPKEDIGEDMTARIRECLIGSGLSAPMLRRPVN